MLGSQHAEGLDEDGQVLSSFERSDGGDERAADDRRNRGIRCCRGDREGSQRNRRDVRVREQVVDLGGRRGRTGMNGRAALDGAAQDSACLVHGTVGECRVSQEPAVVHRHHLWGVARWHDVVGPVHHVRPAEEAIDTRPVGESPQPVCGERRQRQSSGAVGRPRPERNDVVDELEVFDVDQRIVHCCNGVPDPGAWPSERTNIESDSQRVHGQAEASRCRPKPSRSHRLPCPAFPASAGPDPFEGLPACLARS